MPGIDEAPKERFGFWVRKPEHCRVNADKNTEELETSAERTKVHSVLTNNERLSEKSLYTTGDAFYSQIIVTAIGT